MNDGELRAIANALELIAKSLNAGKGPDYRFDLSEYKNFGWGSIGAEVIKRDKHGPTHVKYGGYIWQRRSPDNKYSASIWYSRSTGKDENGDNNYESLAKFQDFSDADPLPPKVLNALRASSKQGNADGQPKAVSEETSDSSTICDYRTYYADASQMGFENSFAKQVALNYGGIKKITANSDYTKALEILNLINKTIGPADAEYKLRDLLEQCSGDYDMVVKQLQGKATIFHEQA